MTQPSTDDKVTCPACLKHGSDGALDATGMVLCAIEALISGDDEQIMAAYENSQPFDFHFAVTMYAEALIGYANLFGMSLSDIVADMRSQLNDALAERASAGDTGGAGTS